MVLLNAWITLAAVLVAAEAVTPVEKVTSLLEGVKKSVEAEGVEEASTYAKFACFCKDTTGAKSKSITEAQDKIDATTADIGSKTALKKEKITKHGQEQQKVEDTTVKLQATTQTHQKDQLEYETQNADLTKALSSIRKALKSLKDSKGAALLSLGDKSDVRNALDLAEALNLVQPSKQRAVANFLQQAKVDPNDAAYKFHSAKIIEIITDLQKDFQSNKDDTMAEWKKTDEAFKAEKASMKSKIETAKTEINKLSGEIDKLKAEIAQHQEDLVTAEDTLKDDSEYLKDLSSRCEEKATEWDQRSSTRNDEVKALTQALKIMKDRVKDADKVNKRALLLAKTAPVVPAKAAAVSAKPVIASKKPTAAAKPADTKATATKAKSFLEADATTQRIARVQVLAAKGRDRAADLLRHEGVRLNSVVLTSLAAQIRADPFGKIKKLIQGLIERLLAESKQEATKKGFCDTELGKSEQARATRFAEINKIDAELAELKAHQEFLSTEITELGANVATLKEALTKATDLRKEEKTENENTLKTSTEGAEAVGEALAVLKDFYKSAAKAAAFVQVAASPVDEDTAGSGFDGAYKGDQDSSKAIFGLLQTIKSDFERTMRKTEADEAKAQEEFVLFQRSSKADIASKETKVELDKQDLDSTKSAIAEGLKDMQTATKLLDAALLSIEELKPTCIDTGMSYNERVQKRQDEMKALKNALCMLDGDKVEAECQ